MVRTQSRRRVRDRRGITGVLAALLLVVLIGMVAFALDLSYISKTRTELQRTADAAALAAAGELLDADELTGTSNLSREIVSAQAQAGTYVAANKSGNIQLSLPEADVTFGYFTPAAYPAQIITGGYGTTNAALVRVRRDETANGKLNLFFAPILGRSNQAITAQSIAYFNREINGFGPPGNGYESKLLPYAMLASDWDAAFASGTDDFQIDGQSQSVTNGADGVREVRLFPLDSGSSGRGNGSGRGTTPGNFGTLDIGSTNNSTADLARQILHGPSAEDFSHFPSNTLELGNSGTLELNGDTGVSAGVSNELASIKGKPRVLPLYTTVNGNGNNAQFTIVKFVGCTIMDVQLTGSLSNKHITVQPAFVIDGTAIGGGRASSSSFITRPLALAE